MKDMPLRSIVRIVRFDSYWQYHFINLSRISSIRPHKEANAERYSHKVSTSLNKSVKKREAGLLVHRAHEPRPRVTDGHGTKLQGGNSNSSCRGENTVSTESGFGSRSRSKKIGPSWNVVSRCLLYGRVKMGLGRLTWLCGWVV